MKKIIISISIVFLSGCSLLSSPKIEVEVDPLVIEVQEEAFVCGRDTVKDADGNDYKTAYFDIDGGHDVEKEGQCWMAENLNVGTVILNPGEDPSDDGVIEKWCLNRFEGHIPSPVHNKEPSDESYCSGIENINSSNSIEEIHKYGGLYSWNEIVLNEELCPNGWDIPTEKDWRIIQERMTPFLNKISPWIVENENLISEFVVGQEFGFPVRIGGYRMKNGVFEANTIYSPTMFWAQTMNRGPRMVYFGFSETDPWVSSIINIRDNEFIGLDSGFSVRCVKK